MIELVYPLDSYAPMLPLRSAETATKRRTRDNMEVFPVIDDDGIVIGRASRQYCHGGSHLLHPVVHLHIISRDEKIYLQKRSMKKDLLPGRWDTAVGGHVKYGEGILEALLRESSEELRFSEYNPIYLGSYRWDSKKESELVNIFAAVGTYDLRPDKDEVDEGRWWTLDQIDEAIGKSILTPNFEQEFKQIRSSLLALL